MRNFSDIFHGVVRWLVRPFQKKLTPGPWIDFLEANRLFKDTPFLGLLSDGFQEELRLVLAGAKYGAVGKGAPSKKEEPDDAWRQIWATSRPVEVDKELACEIVFEQYILYQVRCESFADGDPEEVSQGRWFLICERSTLLSDLQKYTIVSRTDDGSYYPGEWKHYKIVTWHHIVDVVATGEPKVRWWRADKGSSLF
ncbi:MAG: hypothetical protein K2K83_06360 [Rikenella sp.]|nr:hypothetical protein [Rikenella sp.]